MGKCVSRRVSLVVTVLSAVSAFGGVSVSSPGNGSSVQNPIHFVASATTICSGGVAAVSVYDNNSLVTVAKGSKLDANLYLGSGTHNNTVVQSWDSCGDCAKVKLTLKVTSRTLYNLEDSKDWLGYGELAPLYDICTDCRPLVEWGMKQGITSPALGASSTRFDLGGSTPGITGTPIVDPATGALYSLWVPAEPISTLLI